MKFGLLSAITNFFRSLFGKGGKEKIEVDKPDVDEVAQNFYDDLVDADNKRKK